METADYKLTKPSLLTPLTLLQIVFKIHYMEDPNDSDEEPADDVNGKSTGRNDNRNERKNKDTKYWEEQQEEKGEKGAEEEEDDDAEEDLSLIHI